MNLFSHIQSASHEDGITALFYCFRAFEHAKKPLEVRPDIFRDHPSCVPGPEIQAMTLAILAEIEQREGKPIDQFDSMTVRSYTDALDEVGHQLTARLPWRLDPERGERLLREMREEWARPKTWTHSPILFVPATTASK